MLGELLLLAVIINKDALLQQKGDMNVRAYQKMKLTKHEAEVRVAVEQYEGGKIHKKFMTILEKESNSITVPVKTYIELWHAMYDKDKQEIPKEIPKHEPAKKQQGAKREPKKKSR